jgi:DNA transformation protein and related proteins
MVTDNTVYFRVDDHNRAAFKEAEFFPPLSYGKKCCTIDLSFWRAPERLFDGPDELAAGAGIALRRANAWIDSYGSARSPTSDIVAFHDLG